MTDHADEVLRRRDGAFHRASWCGWLILTEGWSNVEQKWLWWAWSSWGSWWIRRACVVRGEVVVNLSTNLTEPLLVSERIRYVLGVPVFAILRAFLNRLLWDREEADCCRTVDVETLDEGL